MRPGSVNKPPGLSVQTEMIRKLSSIAVLSVTVLALVAGCVERRVVYVESPAVAAVPAGQVISQPPPAPQTEVIIAPPAPNYVWNPGYWSWQGRWVWINGSYVVRPYPHAR